MGQEILKDEYILYYLKSGDMISISRSALDKTSPQPCLRESLFPYIFSAGDEKDRTLVSSFLEPGENYLK